MSLSVDVLISCVNNNTAIIKKSNLSHNVVVINQTDVINENVTEYSNNCFFVNSSTRGLSRSRNIAIEKSKADICVVSDDDEIFVDNAQYNIAKIYKQHSKADIIIFNVKNDNRNSKLKNKFHRLNYFELLRVNSWQITFRREKIVKNNLSFDEFMGSGTGNGAGEENKFLIDAYKKGLKIYYYPYQIAYVAEGKSQSQWFKGFNKEFFFQRGYSTRYMLGFPLSILYAIYYAYSHENMYKDQITRRGALKYTFAGIRNNKIARMKKVANANK